jgi:hypothetical protein
LDRARANESRLLEEAQAKDAEIAALKADNAALLKDLSYWETSLEDVVRSGGGADLGWMPQDTAARMLTTIRAQNPGAALLEEANNARELMERMNALEAQCARLSAAGQVLSEHVDKTVGAPLGSLELARNFLGGDFAALPNKERVDTAAPNDAGPFLPPLEDEEADKAPACDGEPDCGWRNGGPCKACKSAQQRAEFAKAALHGLLAHPTRIGSYEAFAKDAVLFADALLAELEDEAP